MPSLDYLRHALTRLLTPCPRLLTDTYLYLKLCCFFVIAQTSKIVKSKDVKMLKDDEFFLGGEFRGPRAAVLDREEICAKLAEKLNAAFDRIWELSEQQQLSLRSAGLVVAIREVAGALDARGIYP